MRQYLNSVLLSCLEIDLDLAIFVKNERVNTFKNLLREEKKRCSIKLSIFSSKHIVSKVGDRSRDWPEGSIFDSYYIKV